MVEKVTEYLLCIIGYMCVYVCDMIFARYIFPPEIKSKKDRIRSKRNERKN